MIRRLPKRGFRQKHGLPERPQIVNVEQLNVATSGERLTPQRLHALGLVKNPARPVKVLGEGALTLRLTVAVQRVSESAKAKIEQAGGTVELLTAKRP